MSMAERTTESGEQMRDWAAIPRRYRSIPRRRARPSCNRSDGGIQVSFPRIHGLELAMATLLDKVMYTKSVTRCRVAAVAALLVGGALSAQTARGADAASPWNAGSDTTSACLALPSHEMVRRA